MIIDFVKKEQTVQLGFNQSVNDKISAAGGISYLDLKRNPI